MKNSRIIIVCLCVVFVLIGCNNTSEQKDINETVPAGSVTVNDRSFALKDINDGVKVVFNNALYYFPQEYKPFLNQSIEYDLFFLRQTNDNSYSRIYIVITNMEHPLSNKQSPKLYRFGILITEKGMQSVFYEESYISSLKKCNTRVPEGADYLGHYTMHIDEIIQPTYEIMTDQWKHKAENAIRLYMDKNDFYSGSDKNLPIGKYNVYIQGFSESDTDSRIVFEHENGQIYLGQYYFVHDISNTTADLNHVELLECDSADYAEYLSRLKLNAALHIEYSVNSK